MERDRICRSHTQSARTVSVEKTSRKRSYWKKIDAQITKIAPRKVSGADGSARIETLRARTVTSRTADLLNSIPRVTNGSVRIRIFSELSLSLGVF